MLSSVPSCTQPCRPVTKRNASIVPPYLRDFAYQSGSTHKPRDFVCATDRLQASSATASPSPSHPIPSHCCAPVTRFHLCVSTELGCPDRSFVPDAVPTPPACSVRLLSSPVIHPIDRIDIAPWVLQHLRFGTSFASECACCKPRPDCGRHVGCRRCAAGSMAYVARRIQAWR
jgi:hypothetical protein